MDKAVCVCGSNLGVEAPCGRSQREKERRFTPRTEISSRCVVCAACAHGDLDARVNLPPSSKDEHTHEMSWSKTMAPLCRRGCGEEGSSSRGGVYNNKAGQAQDRYVIHTRVSLIGPLFSLSQVSLSRARVSLSPLSLPLSLVCERDSRGTDCERDRETRDGQSRKGRTHLSAGFRILSGEDPSQMSKRTTNG